MQDLSGRVACRLATCGALLSHAHVRGVPGHAPREHFLNGAI